MKVWELMTALAKLPSGADVNIVTPEEDDCSYKPARVEHEEDLGCVTIVTVKDEA